VLKTRLRSIGPPEQLRRQVFSSDLEVQVAAPLPDPSGVFATDGISGWEAKTSGVYVLHTTDPASAAPAVVRSLVAAGADVLRVAEVEHSLEDVYLELVESPS